MHFNARISYDKVKKNMWYINLYPSI
jgi:hypothetical protein